VRENTYRLFKLIPKALPRGFLKVCQGAEKKDFFKG